MTAKEKLFELLRNNETLSKQLDKAFEYRNPEKAVRAILTENGITLEEDALRELLSLRQKELCEHITAQDLDLEQLATVSGGGDGKCDWAADGDAGFKVHPTYTDDERCTFTYLCDESFFCYGTNTI